MMPGGDSCSAAMQNPQVQVVTRSYPYAKDRLNSISIMLSLFAALLSQLTLDLLMNTQNL